MSALSEHEPHVAYVLRLADSNLVLAQRLGEWVGHAPALEEDLALANIALDLLGQARLLLTHAGVLEGKGRDEDALAFLREEREFLNVALVEQPNGDFGDTIARQFLHDAWQVELYGRLAASRDAQLAAIATKALRESTYHLRFSAGWMVRLGDGTDESHRRVEESLGRLWPCTLELCEADDLDRAMLALGIGVDLAAVRAGWDRRVNDTLTEATLTRPADRPWRWFGKRGVHGEHLGRLLAEMQSLHRAHPGAQW
ncbi:MAG: 1,2-phenylacetyl-CoA epoxidase, subunit C [Steroidobacteraceae bacterium]|nr:1,2-phenylacetyl-CoA epoxidase, subunit C [Steroidobacteraceae bacterium]